MIIVFVQSCKVRRIISLLFNCLVYISFNMKTDIIFSGPADTRGENADGTQLTCQKNMFAQESNVHYLNCAAYSPILISSKKAGIKGIEVKSNPQNITPNDHFHQPEILRRKISAIINSDDHNRIAVFPSVSYGMAIVANNLHRINGIESKKKIIVLEEEFPNDTYAFCRAAEKFSLLIESVAAPSDIEKMGEDWNHSLIEAINEETALVVVPHVHWMYGVVFDLQAIACKCRCCGALLAVDGTQSVGMLPFDISVIQPDALICAGYKWLLGPYAMSFGYFGEFFDEGVPLEESWMNRTNSQNFSSLTRLVSTYHPKAQRYNMGEFSEFIQSVMWEDALDQMLIWGVERMCAYVRGLGAVLVRELGALGCRFVCDEFRAPHLFGVLLPVFPQQSTAQDTGTDCGGSEQHRAKIVDALKSRKVFVSLRGQAIRVSINVFNDLADIEALVLVLRSFFQ